MDTGPVNIDKLCRTCLKEELSISLYNVDLNTGLRPMEMFFKITNIQIFEKDKLPNAICSDCYYKLSESYQYKLQCEETDIKLRQYLEENEKRAKNNNLDMNNGDAEIRAAMDELFGGDQQNEIPLENSLYQVNILDQAVISDDVKNDLVNIDNLDLILNDNKTEKIQRKKPIKKNPKSTKKSKPIKMKAQLDELLKTHKEKMKEENSKVKKIFKQKRKKKLMVLNQPDQCFECGKIFHYKGYLEIHMKSHQNLKPHECQFCQKKFTQSNNLTLHLRTHTGAKPFQCEKCSKFFSTSSNLNAHLKIHIGIKNFQCNLCPRAFKSQAELQSHHGTHSGIKSRICKICGKSFYKTSYLNVHIRNIHNGVKKYKCTDCDKSFSSSSNLICHKRIHSGEKPYACSTCGTKFNQSSSLARHIKSHNKGSNKVKTPKEKPLVEEVKIIPEVVEVPKPPPPAIIQQSIPQQQSTTNEFTIESVLDQQGPSSYSHDTRNDRIISHHEPQLNLNLSSLENHHNIPVINSINHNHNQQHEIVHHEQYPALLPDPLNPINLINNNTSNAYNSLALPNPPTSSLLMAQTSHEDHHQIHHFNYENPTPNYIPSNSFNFIDFAKTSTATVPQSAPQLSMINQNFDFTKMLPPPLPTNNFIPGGLDFSKNSLNGQPTYIDY